MTKHRTLDWRGWLYGLGAGSIGGVATSIVTVVGGQMVGAATFTPRQLGTVAVVSLLINAALYLKQSPLPKVIEFDDGLPDSGLASLIGDLSGTRSVPSTLASDGPTSTSSHPAVTPGVLPPIDRN